MRFDRMEQIQMSEQEHKNHMNILELRDEALRAKVSHCKKETEYTMYMNDIYAVNTGNMIKSNEKEQILKLKKECIDSKEHLNQCINKLIVAIRATSQQSGVEKYLKMWEKMPLCFAEILLGITNGNFFQRVTVNDVINASKFNKGLDNFNLIEENNEVFIVDQDTGFKSSPCLACHVSSGSMCENGYRHVNFLTQSGSVYWGTGTLMDPKSKLILNTKLPILTK